MSDPTQNNSDRHLTPGDALGPLSHHASPSVQSLVPLSPMELFGILRRHLLLVALVTVGATMTAVWYARSVQMLYSARAVIRLQDVRGSMTGGLAERPADARLGTQVDPVLSQVEVLQSRAVASEVVDSMPVLRVSTSAIPLSRVAVLAVPEADVADSVAVQVVGSTMVVTHAGVARTESFGRELRVAGARLRIDSLEPGTEGVIYLMPRDGGIRRVLGGLKVKQRESTDVVDVVYSDPDPARAQEVANRVVAAFQSVSARTSQQESIRRRLFLEAQLKYHDSVLTAARVALSGFRTRERAYSARARIESEQAGIEGLAVRRGELAAQRGIVAQLFEQLNAADPQSDVSESVGALLSTPEVVGNPAIGQLYSQLVRYRHARDSLTLGGWGLREGNPDVVRVDQLIASTRTQLVAAVRGLLNSIDARLASLDELKARSTRQFPQLTSSEEEETALVDAVTVAQSTVTELRGEYEKARLAEAVHAGEVVILDLAPRPLVPDGISPLVRVVFGGIVGLLLGGLVACVLDRLNTSIRRRRQVVEVLGVRELTIIPPFGRPPLGMVRNGAARRLLPAKSGRTVVMEWDRQSFSAEAFRLLRTNLVFARANGAFRSVVITSTYPKEGKTTVAANLATAFAQQGMRVLLVDADMRRGRVHTLFKVYKGPGLGEALRGAEPFDRVIQETEIANLSVITAGAVPKDPTELLGRGAAATMLATLNGKFELVIVDTPPLLAAADAAIVAAAADATVMVIRAGVTKESEARIALERLTAVHAKVVGVVMNDQDSVMKQHGEVYYEQYYGAPGP